MGAGEREPEARAQVRSLRQAVVSSENLPIAASLPVFILTFYLGSLKLVF